VITLHWKYNNYDKFTLHVDLDFILSERFEKGRNNMYKHHSPTFYLYSFCKNLLSLSHLRNLRHDVIFNCDVIVKWFPQLSMKVIYLP
jgi:hypothetical protein